MKAVLVTGAGGFVGRNLVAALDEAGIEAVGVDVRPAPEGSRGGHLVADFAASQVLEQVRAGRFAAVLHQAAITSTLADDWDELQRVNIDGCLALAEACAASDTLLVYASSSSVYGTIRQPVPVGEDDVDDPALCSGPLNLYGRSKLAFDRIMLEKAPDGLRWAGLRYTNVFGSGEQDKGSMASILSQLLRTAARREAPRLFADTLEASRDYVPVRWLADVVLRIIDRGVPSGVYNLGSGRPVTFATLLRWCADFGGGEELRVRLVPNPIADRYQYWTCADMTRLTGALDLDGLTQEQVRAAAERLYADFRAAAVA
ncbi:NAD-dependent epimerase/dehydratase family protein [Catellatospora sp. NPDC049609]|uniref:NAD-dependent epimerase/dehydratase family protein n=1 Tax=Catellatospora sp. NPDC049609 TaxID=3155505 RepID=UPI00342F4055